MLDAGKGILSMYLVFFTFMKEYISRQSDIGEYSLSKNFFVSDIKREPNTV